MQTPQHRILYDQLFMQLSRLVISETVRSLNLHIVCMFYLLLYMLHLLQCMLKGLFACWQIKCIY